MISSQKNPVNTNTFEGPSFSWQNRVARVLWNVIYFVLFIPSPIPLYGWRTFLLRCFGAKIGRKVHIYPRVKIWAPWNIEIGDETGIANSVNLYSQGKIIIGKRVVISQGSYICTGTHNYEMKGFPLLTFPILIGDQVWVAADCFVHPGVTIGEGTVVGARSVVNKSLPPWMVCVGFPCKPVKPRVIVD